MSVFERAFHSSAIVRAIRRFTAAEWSARQEAVEAERMRALLSTSRIAAVVSSVVNAPVLASREAAIRRGLAPLVTMDLVPRIRTGSCAIIVAVVCHTALLALFGVRVYTLGWVTRVVLLAAGVMGLRWPEPFAAAWKDRQTRSR